MCTAPPAAQAVTEAEVVRLQTAWANAITTISSIHKDKGDYVQAAADAAAELYGYGHSQVLFKPTKAVEHTFRPTGGEAMSYFVGGSAVEGGYSEDAGFAINGGNGWSEVVFDNHAIDLNGPVAIAMGLYVFTCATTGQKVPVEYTFGYKRNQDGKARIFFTTRRCLTRPREQAGQPFSSRGHKRRARKGYGYCCEMSGPRARNHPTPNRQHGTRTVPVHRPHSDHHACTHAESASRGGIFGETGASALENEIPRLQ